MSDFIDDEIVEAAVADSRSIGATPIHAEYRRVLEFSLPLIGAKLAHDLKDQRCGISNDSYDKTLDIAAARIRELTGAKP